MHLLKHLSRTVCSPELITCSGDTDNKHLFEYRQNSRRCFAVLCASKCALESQSK
jgi:hypothetical protein